MKFDETSLSFILRSITRSVISLSSFFPSRNRINANMTLCVCVCMCNIRSFQLLLDYAIYGQYCPIMWKCHNFYNYRLAIFGFIRLTRCVNTHCKYKIAIPRDINNACVQMANVYAAMFCIVLINCRHEYTHIHVYARQYTYFCVSVKKKKKHYHI